MDNWVAAVALLGTILGIMAAAGGSVVWFRASYNRARLEALREDLDDSMRREELHDRQMDDARSRITALEEQVRSLQKENGYLRELSTSRAAVEAVAEQLALAINVISGHHNDAMGRFNKIDVALVGISETMIKVEEAVVHG